MAALEGLPEGEPLSPAPKQTADGSNDLPAAAANDLPAAANDLPADLPAAEDTELDGWDDDVQGDWGL